MSTHKKPEKDDPPPSKANLERHVYEAMRSLGWIIPTTEEDVARAESMLSREAVELPEELKDPYHILKSMDTDCPASDPEPVPVDAEVEENLGGEHWKEEETLNTLAEAIRACGSEEAFTASAERMRSAVEVEADLILNMMPMLAKMPREWAARFFADVYTRFSTERDRSLFGLVNALWRSR